jgi:uncharacterized secreted protein with C-terminal beta-propeller domain/putative cell wall-binding protein
MKLRAAALASGLLVTLLAPVAARPAAAAAPVADGVFDGDPATTERINEGEPTYAAVDVSEIRFDDGAADHVVLSRDDSFADSVAGSALTGDGPLLYTDTDALSSPTREEIARGLDPGDTVYLLGGTAAISPAVEGALQDDGYKIDRLAGANRVETAIEVADAVRAEHPGDDILLARDSGWADSVSGGAVAAATGTPVLVTGSDSLDPEVAAGIQRDGTAHTTLLGGTAALSPYVEAVVPDPERISGADRTATAAAVAEQLWDDTDQQYVVTQGLADDGWTYGFAAAGLAADADAPVLLVTDEVTEPTADLVSTCGAPEVDLAVVGDGDVVPAPLREQLDAADGLACGPGGSLVYPSDLTAFPECADVLAAFKESALERVGPYGLGGYGTIAIDPMPVPALADSPEDNSGGSPTNDSTSGTNVQEEGVDEPDVVKTDGEYAYIVAGTELQIVRLNAGNPQRAATMDLPADGNNELLLSGDRLLVLTQAYRIFYLDGGPAATSPVEPGGQVSQTTTTLTSIDVSDPTDPQVLSTMVVDGDYRSARMIGSTARVVIQSDPGALDMTYPTEDTDESRHDAAEHNREVIEATTLDDWLPTYTIDGGDDQALLDCADVRRPSLFSGLGTLSVVTIDVAGSLEPSSTAAVMASGETVYASTSRLYVTTGRWGWEADALGTTVSTEVHAFDIADPDATAYVGSGAVDGYVLNQFALSELDGNLRIATTTEPPWSDEGEQLGETESGIHVLDEQSGDLVEIGAVTGLGGGERIYAVRYFDDVAAIVTFEQTDPLFLVDLSDPTAPRVTGQLDLTGYSAYLHRVGDDRLLGVGRTANEDGSVTGAQVSLFDIGDTTHPRLVDQVEYPNGYSSVEYDHHAFLYWPATGLAVLPLEVYTESGSAFVGAAGVAVSSGGLAEAGRATHTDDVTDDNVYPAITRSFVSGGRLYTVSPGGIEADSLSTLRELAFLRF